MFGILKGGFGGWEWGVAIYENPGFPVSKPGVSQFPSENSPAGVARKGGRPPPEPRRVCPEVSKEPESQVFELTPNMTGRRFHRTKETAKASCGETVVQKVSKSETWVPKRGGLKPAGKRQESATFLQRSDFDVAAQFFVCCSAAFSKNDFRTAEKRMLQCSFCSAAFQKLQRNFRFRLWHVAGVGFRGVGFRTC